MKNIRKCNLKKRRGKGENTKRESENQWKIQIDFSSNLFISIVHAPVVKLVDTLDSKSGVRKDVRVRVPLWAVTILLVLPPKVSAYLLVYF